MPDHEDTKPVPFFYVAMSCRDEVDAPQVDLKDGDVNVWPAGVGGPYLSTSIEGWRILNAAVEAAISKDAIARMEKAVMEA